MARKRAQRTVESVPEADPNASRPKRIFVSYSHGDPDQSLAQALIHGLGRAGHAVYIDTEIKLGADWGTMIPDWISASDYCVVLLSSRSVHSEYVREEVRLARDGRSVQGKPLLLPVRVKYAGPLGYPLGAWLNPFQWASWETEADTGRLILQILSVVDGGSAPPPSGSTLPTGPTPPDDFGRPEPMADPSRLSQPTVGMLRPGGTLRPDDPYYIERTADGEIFDIAHHLLEQTVVIKAPRQMGKSSLLKRYLAECRRAGKKTALVDLSLFGSEDLASYPKFLAMLASELLDRFELEGEPAISGSAHMSRFVRDNVLRKVPDNLVLAFDEVEARVLGKPYQSGFFSMLRNWHEQRADLSKPEWARLELALVISTEPYLLIRDVERSPFNSSEPITLPLFNASECRELNRRYEYILSDEQAERLRRELLNGHPFLTRLAYYRLSRPNAPSLADLIRDAARIDGPFGDHLRTLVVKLRENMTQDLPTALRQVIHHGTAPNDDALARLLGAGLVCPDGERFVPANQLYARFFGKLQ